MRWIGSLWKFIIFFLSTVTMIRYNESLAACQGVLAMALVPIALKNFLTETQAFFGTLGAYIQLIRLLNVIKAHSHELLHTARELKAIVKVGTPCGFMSMDEIVECMFKAKDVEKAVERMLKRAQQKYQCDLSDVQGDLEKMLKGFKVAEGRSMPDGTLEKPADIAEETADSAENAAVSSEEAAANAVLKQLVSMKPKLEPVAMKHGLTWEDVLPVLETFDTVEEIQEAVSSPEEFFADLAAEGLGIGRKVLLSKLKTKLGPVAMKHGLTWEDVLPVLESFDTVEEIQEAVSSPEEFFADLAEDGADIGKKVLLFKAISKLKAKLEPMLTSHGLQWSAVLSLLQGVSIDELQKALSDPESFLSDLVGSMGSSVEAAEAEAEASVEVEAEEAAAAATVAEIEATAEEAEEEEEEEAEEDAAGG